MEVLIVDDSEIVRNRLVDMLLEIQDIDTINHAEDLQKAVSLLDHSYPDVIILDLQLPDGNGLELLDKIKKLQINPIIIVLTNYSFPQYRKKSLDLGIKYFYDKSKEFNCVYELLKDMVSKSQV
ncbi:MAG: response regulator transcription factor [Actinobacteria bacterium]|nr:response regulator transcription factor [Actinomycetota bacterium]